MKTKSKYAALAPKPRLWRGLSVFLICLAALVSLPSCARREETQVQPPETFLLSQPHIGYGVVNVLYARIDSDLGAGSAAVGHMRQGTIVRVMERRQVMSGGRSESWLFVEGDSAGWIREDFVNVYANLPQARTAAAEM